MMRLLQCLVLAGILLTAFSGCREKKSPPTKFPVEITSAPNGAKVFVGERELGITPLTLKGAPPGTFRLKLERTGCLPEWAQLKVVDRAVKLHVPLTPITADVLITSKPAEAQIEINGTVVGETPLVLKKQEFGAHSAMIKKLGFVTRKVNWEVKSGRPLLIYTSISTNVGILDITSDPTDAVVSINGQPSGATPLRKEVEQGKYRITVTREGYSTFEEEIIAKRHETVSLEAKLTRLPGGIKITSAPSGAAIFIGGKTMGSTPLTLDNLKPGKYAVKADKPGFDPSTQEIELVAGRVIPLHFDLGSNTGGIDLVANPPGVTIYLNGKIVGTSQPDEDGKFAKVFNLRGLTAGVHTIAIAHKRAQPQQKTIKVTVKKGEIARPKKISMWIANAELRLKSGRRMVGYLSAETPLEVFFEPEPGVRQGFRRDEIESLEMLKDTE